MKKFFPAAIVRKTVYIPSEKFLSMPFVAASIPAGAVGNAGDVSVLTGPLTITDVGSRIQAAEIARVIGGNVVGFTNPRRYLSNCCLRSLHYVEREDTMAAVIFPDGREHFESDSEIVAEWMMTDRRITEILDAAWVSVMFRIPNGAARLDYERRYPNSIFSDEQIHEITATHKAQETSHADPK